MKRIIAIFLTLILTTCISCSKTPSRTLNGVDIAEYVIVYSANEPDYNKTAAEYLRDEIREKTGVELTIATDDTKENAHEILVGETSRALSAELDADTEGLAFATLANATSIAMEGDYFVIAAAAYFFMETYITGNTFDAVIADTVAIHTPIVKTPKNFIFLIGDGMGVYQTKLFEYADAPNDYQSDGEDLFYGYMLPYKAMARTDSLSGTTDSAAGGTALATGYKTYNGYIGRDKDKNNVMSLTELAASLGKATAVMSTESMTGATPAAFSAHADDRDATAEITASQQELKNTLLKTVTDTYNNRTHTNLIANALKELSADEDGFFIMYEEAHIDKNCHNNDLDATYKTVLRFNQAIGQFMEFAFYHPDTFLLITADHETGALLPNANGDLKYNSEDHSNADVPVFAFGEGADIFNGLTVENVQIPKTIAKMWGIDSFGDTNSPYPHLAK